MTLTAGEYRGGLRIHSLHGAAGHRIVIQGPPRITGAKAVFVANDRINTISLATASYVTIRDLWLDGRNADADAVKAEGGNDPVHHITLERLTIIGHGRGQDIVGISTKSPAWNWIIRDNVIVGAGTGMYLGNSDGRAPFVAGIIENNAIIDSIGYDIEIKHQVTRPELDGMPNVASVTTLRGNVFTKTANFSTGEAARPSVLLGAFPSVGSGRDDRYDFIGNVLFDNGSEALFQGEGNLRVVGNVFINRQGNGLVLQPHHDRPRRVTITNNFVSVAGRGIAMTGADPNATQHVADNLVYAGLMAAGAPERLRDGRYREAVGALKRWLGRAWTRRQLLERVSALKRACSDALIGEGVCTLLDLLRVNATPRREARSP
jgi:hypothetical protein